jgi:anti-repressor protein
MVDDKQDALIRQAKNFIVKLTEQLEQTEQKLELVINENHELVEQNKTWVQVSTEKNAIDMKMTAKVLNYKNIGRTKLFAILRDNKILATDNEPYQTYIDSGYFRVIEQDVNLGNGNHMINKKTLVLQKGLDYIRRLLDKLGYEVDYK